LHRTVGTGWRAAWQRLSAAIEERGQMPTLSEAHRDVRPKAGASDAHSEAPFGSRVRNYLKHFLPASAWAGSLLSLTGAAIVAMNPGREWVWWSYIVFAVASAAWIMVGVARRDYALLAMQFGFLGLNALGLIRWS
jgi:hypothetical protein